MLTCKVGENIIDTFSFKDEKLREWSNKSMLKCPVCEGKMLFCHGDYKIPYFRHENNKDCPDIYSEGVTEEHLKGIKMLYDWLKSQDYIFNLQLEKWIPETRQRPDIYFERNENNLIKKYAIEFQCSPIATKYNERHDLYRLNNINDIWILGMLKYNINDYNIENLIYNNQSLGDCKTKTLEREIYNSDKPLTYLNVINKRIYQIKSDGFKEVRSSKWYWADGWCNEPCKTKFNVKLNGELIDNCCLDNIKEKDTIITNKEYYENVINKTKEYLINFFSKQDILNDIKINPNNKITKTRPLISFNINDKNFAVEYIRKNNKKDYNDIYKGSNIIPIIIVDNLVKDVNMFDGYIIDLINKTIQLPYKMRNKSFKSSLDNLIFDGENLECSESKNYIFKEQINDFIAEKKRDYDLLLREQNDILIKVKEQIETDKFEEEYLSILNEKIILIDGYYRIHNDSIRFKYVKDYEDTEEFFKTQIINNINFLKNIKVKNMYLMISKDYCGRRPCIRNMNYLLHTFKKYGFTNVSIYSEELNHEFD